MERKARTRRRAPARRLKPPQAFPRSGASTPWPTLEAFVNSEEGDITLGTLGYMRLGCTAIASDEGGMLVALVRRPDETLHQLLDRLEHALGPAIDDQIFIDEINPPCPPTKSTRR